MSAATCASSASHGLSPSTAEKREVAEQEAAGNPDLNSSDLAKRWSVPARTMARWVGPIVARHRDVRGVQIRLLVDAGWTQAKIGKAVDAPRETVRNALAESATWPNRPSTDLVSAAVVLDICPDT